MSSAPSSQILQVIIRLKDRILWQGEATSFSSTNQIGPFDILPEHARFVGLIEQYITVHTLTKEEKWPIAKGILSVKDSVVEAYLDY
ncbi:MAG: hypothetical protein UX38_C0012G0012 [Microgenomates group bacterium GW2011_GWC1_46_16]|uniref:ATP synthase F1 complex delta/epsilon subunit N-terminal domain-containing protein n=3 Tax=Bacteria candidate phyla TaxID=1783234 RepID=A0A1F5FZ99_9BACT|nr:MAG: hypothetical protein UV00_C0023G0007 [candidate division WWE3 bacterium GW2011_GWF1_42_14]KKU25926.1 MAG: hypothetical protein UX38_C0012G0012 [Microgenomates group bacterium GW2011_GWC1_46_16]KKU27684.1 MAG: hypothetical protein UX40_C0008G0005 [Microgenomates group bacterium GW2011_GWF2_46_18]KKU43361.1 MAG: hypothetical protein UX59_C0021G0019 [Microgenomates group bacterium GW2011_GWA1_46_7]KKU45040.1 MAG: hypothetical protein UX63_C0014G0006 [Microgenomates group bacterium GW2011_G